VKPGNYDINIVLQYMRC